MPGTHTIQTCAVTTRSQAKKKDERTALKVPSSRESPIVDREKLKQMQREDESLRKYWDRDDVLVKGQAEISFEKNVEYCTVCTSTLM